MWHAHRTNEVQGNVNKRALSSDWTASSAFKRFCYQVLMATGVKDSVVFLCLKYIANLLQAQRKIKAEASEGSEYRLFIVALMLANKFLDDHTYTNQSWSEVSGMKVGDLNRMEAEFLSALNFRLFVRAQEFAIWKILLDTCRQRYPIRYTDAATLRQQAAYHTLHTLGLYEGASHWLDTPYVLPAEEKVEEVDHIARITGLLERSYQRYVKQGKRACPQPPQPYYAYPSLETHPLALLPSPVTLQPPVARPAYHHHHPYHASRRTRLPPITNLSQKSWDPLAYTLRCQALCTPKTDPFYSNSRTVSWAHF
ncbi:cyclin-domain-containing protein [Sporodiniella umbellata]|nr:cyclin-domain-containing protein [Sporodiniella umbellata]